MAPTSMMATISSEVATGRSMKIRDGFMSRSGLLVGLGGGCAAGTTAAVSLAPPLLLLGLAGAALLGVGRVGDRRARRGARRAATRTADLGAVAQAVGAVDHDLVAGLQALHDLHLLAVGRAELDDADLDRVVALHQIDEGAGLAALDGGHGHD